MIQNSGQFGGLPAEDPLSHLRKFLRITDTVQYQQATAEAIRLGAFPFSLTGKALDWLSSLPDDSITTWNQCAQKFLAKYYPLGKINQLKKDIANFCQYE